MDGDVLSGERSSAIRSIFVFALAIVLVYLCLAGQYESWIAPLGVILAVPLALIGPAIALAPRRSPTTSTPRSASCC